MKTLFELGVPEIEAKVKGNQCRNCKFMISHEYNSGFKYCTKQKSKRTSYGFKKIKARDVACWMFERKV